MLHHSFIANEIVICNRAEEALCDVVGVASNVHILLNQHILIEPDERSLYQIVALTVAVKSLLLWSVIFSHELIVRIPYFLAGSSRLKHRQRLPSGLQDDLKVVLQLLRGLSKNTGSAQLCGHCPGPVRFDEEREYVSLAQYAIL